MIELRIQTPDGKIREDHFPEGITAEAIAEMPEYRMEHRLLSARLNRLPVRLTEEIRENGDLALLDMTDSSANMCYQTSLTLLYLKAVHDVCGKNVSVMIANSLSKGLFTRLHVPAVTDEMAEKIEARMKEIAQSNVPFEEKTVNRTEALVWLHEHGSFDERELYESNEELQSGILCSLLDEEALFFDHLLPSSGYLEYFEVRRYRSGMLLRFPHQQNPGSVPEYKEQKLLYEAFSEETHWEKLMGISYAGDLNKVILRNETKDLIMLSEALHEKKIAEIAREISEKKKRIILIAGPSSSGKTSFARRLCTQLRVIGLKPLYLGTDDYFVDRADLIPDENGKLNYEDLDALDTELFEEQIASLLSGKKTDLPEYDFIEGKKHFGRRIISVEHDTPLVIEGIHGLNPALAKNLPEEEKYKIYISPLTQLNIDRHHRIPTTDARMLRRMVRDARTRGSSAKKTIASWQDVRKGEEKNIFPYCDEADMFFNSCCLYELAVLKKYAVPLLEEITPEEKEYPEAQRMLRFLEFFRSIEDDSCIALNSIVREFTGGSIVVN